jgi:ArsR family transcriptional regulator, arsenate/arsenite/antimonite-responsive transcriptional repressor
MPATLDRASTVVNASGTLGRMVRAPLTIAEQATPEVCCTPLARTPLSADGAARLAGLLKALADPTRLRLVSLIQAHEGGEACVCELTEPLGLTQPTISHHLRVLLDAGLIEREKRGVWAYYRTVPASFRMIADILAPPAA